ncbi:Cu2+-containing amine oxidase (plasmid) [Rubrobacter radiotolerans]|uniref:Amine oxidase n=1 Tax=Rubrobacter radiotolerans TaxID=42256 RepID=A0A023X8G8_RUBRA|nr:primary-amine oxidase [Rubrobacter radiotolerans]AHY48354.1 Cu2+-containing amine oxidase [Rubrobacter radiotolerans]MDX5895491.1 primary-amine oxidase [Rubrobacter radiotolerans]SMC01552.1 primary-amine oxidase [Rubrobacter radiotolerans DSM 5868]
MAMTERPVSVAGHPLEPLSREEVERAVSIVREEKELGPKHRFAGLTLNEPPKEDVLAFSPGDAFEREAHAVILDTSDGSTYEAVVSLSHGEVTSWTHIPDVQPPVVLEEFDECEAACKASPEFREALRKRGVTDMDRVMVDPWSAGSYGDEEGRRLSRALTWVYVEGDHNPYAHPVDNLVTVVDLNTMEVVRVEDYGVVPIPQESGSYEPNGRQMRSDLKPLEITQPEGVSFEIDGHEVRWQKWSFRIGFTPREGLVLYTVGYRDKGRVRPVLYRASLSEMVVPYGDPRPGQWRKNAFDAGEYNIGALANSLELGCDCLGEIRYFDAVMTNGAGDPYTIKNAVCLHEEDDSLLWKHFDMRAGTAEVRRSRKLVVSFIATVANYEYGFYWSFHQDGTIGFECKLTGIVSTGALGPEEKSRHGQLLNTDGLYAPIHQHFMNFRLDLDVDGTENRLYEVHTEAVPPGDDNPHGNAFFSKSTLLESESEAQFTTDSTSARHWRVESTQTKNKVGEPCAYRLIPQTNVLPFFTEESAISRRAGFAKKHFWATPYAPDERHAAGAYPNQSPGDGLPNYTRDDRSLDGEDVVVWYTLGAHHVVRVEDWPVMPVQHAGFKLEPAGFFDENPALDVPPPKNGHCH